MSKNLTKLFVFLLLPILVYGECTCDKDSGDRNKSEALKYKLVGIGTILVAGAIGVCLPIVATIVPALNPEKDVFFLIKSLAAGVILATGFIHVLPDASEDLTSPCLTENPWGKFPFAEFVAMCAAIATLMVDATATSFYKKQHAKNNSHVQDGDLNGIENQVSGGDANSHTHTTHGHSHGSTAFVGDPGSELLRNRVVSQVLELGIIVHSVIIGISLGASQSPSTIKPLVAALTFHQFFEGMGLGGCISQARFKGRVIAVMVLFFSLTTPVGIGIGIGISNGYDENSSKSLIIEGIFNAASAGILIYMALVDLLAADFMNPKLQSNGWLRLGACVSLLLGAGCMSLLAKWA